MNMNNTKRMLTIFLLFVGTLGILWHFRHQIFEERTVKIICIVKSIDNTDGFWQSLMEGAKLAASEFEIELSIRGPEIEGDYQAQNLIIQEAITEKPDAIVLAPEDYKNTCEAARAITNQGIKLILIDSDLEDKIADAQIATDNYQAGIRMGAIMKRLIGEGDEIGIVSHVKGTSTAIDREEGIRMGLTDDEDKISSIVFCDSNYEKAEQLTRKMLEENPNITVIAGLNQYASVGAGKAVKDMGLEKTIRIIGFDNARAQIKYLEEGIFEAIVIQKSFNMGYLGVESAVKLIRKEPVSKEIDSGSTVITKDNMYSRLNQKLLFPFEEN